MLDFGTEFRSARLERGLTQADVAAATGVARPNITAYEAGRREPRLSTAIDLLAAVHATITINSDPVWTWTTGRRPYAAPNKLWRLPTDKALSTITTGQHLWWSGPDRNLDLSNTPQRQRAYEIVLREGRPQDIETIVDGVLLIQAWQHLVLPADLRHAWTPAIDTALNPNNASAA